MKTLFFLTNDFVSTQTLLPIFNDIKRAGCDLTFCNISQLPYFPLNDIIGNGLNYFPIIDQDQDNIQCLSKELYISACGDDIDFLQCLTPLHHTNKFPLTEEYLFLDSPLYQRFYGFAFRVEQLLKTIAPKLIFCWQGNNPFAKIIFCKAKKLHISILNCETSFFPDSYVLDPWGMHFFPEWNLVDKKWAEMKDRPLNTEQEAALSQYLTAWRTNRQSKYSQYSDIDEERMFSQLINEGKKILFFPGQVHDDASVMNGLALFEKYEDIFNFVKENLPEDWLLIHKLHPYDQLKNVSVGRNCNTLVVKSINIHDLISRADAVFTHSSTVGLEALVYGKPVICCGKPIYGNKGFTFDLTSLESLESLTDMASVSPNTELLDRFLYQILFDYLIKNGDIEHLQDRIFIATELATTEIDNPRAPFCHTYQKYAKEYIEFARLFNDDRLGIYAELLRYVRLPSLLDADYARNLVARFHDISAQHKEIPGFSVIGKLIVQLDSRLQELNEAANGLLVTTERLDAELLPRSLYLEKPAMLVSDLKQIANTLQVACIERDLENPFKQQMVQLADENQGLRTELLRAEAQLELLKDLFLNNLGRDSL